MQVSELLFWMGMDLAFLLLFFTTIYLTALLIYQRRRLFLMVLPLLLLNFLTVESISMKFYQETWPSCAGMIALWLVSLPKPVLLFLCAGSGTLEISLLLLARYSERRKITAMSIKEATDSLPTGLCFYLPGGRVIMQNRAIESFCLKTTGGMLLNGERFRQVLFSGDLLQGCQRIITGENPVIILPDGTVWSVTAGETSYDQISAQMLTASDVTQLYHTTAELRKQQEKLERLNARLIKYNREIVTLTARAETLRAKILIHDTLGTNLLSMKRYLLNGGNEQKKNELMEKLNLELSFLKKDTVPAADDEYELMLKTAEKLGVHVQITGTLPQTEPQKHILAVSIHECFTNTLRHARGDRMFMTVTEDTQWIRTVFTNNGIQPEGEIHEKGGLQSLRILVEQHGGRMIIHSHAPFSITLELPKEENHVL